MTHEGTAGGAWSLLPKVGICSIEPWLRGGSRTPTTAGCVPQSGGPGPHVWGLWAARRKGRSCDKGFQQYVHPPVYHTPPAYV
jgi:hypothetical protein